MIKPNPLRESHAHVWTLVIQDGKILCVYRDGRWKGILPLNRTQRYILNQRLQDIHGVPNRGIYTVTFTEPSLFARVYRDTPVGSVGRMLYIVDIRQLKEGLQEIRDSLPEWERFLHCVAMHVRRKMTPSQWQDDLQFKFLESASYWQMHKTLYDQDEIQLTGTYRGRTCPIRGRPYVVTEGTIYVRWAGYKDHSWRGLLELRLSRDLITILQSQLRGSAAR